MSATKNRLVGADATLFRGSVAATATTSGNMTAGAIYQIATISGTTVFPEGFEVGDYFLGDASKALTAGNSAYLVTNSESVDVTQFTLEFSADEIEVTTLSDDVKKYRKGKTDMSGNISGINFIDEMKKAGSFLNRFLRTVTTTSAYGTSALSAVDNTPMVGIFYLQKDATTTTETTAIMICDVETFGYSLGASIGDAQTWESGVRATNRDPIVFFRANS